MSELTTGMIPMHRTQAPASQINPAEPIVNVSMLEKYAARNTGLLERLVSAYLEEAQIFHRGIREGSAGQDLELVKLNAHSLKSASHNLGALRLARMCQEIETAAGEDDITDVEDRISKVGPELFEVEQTLRANLLKLTGKTVKIA